MKKNTLLYIGVAGMMLCAPLTVSAQQDFTGVKVLNEQVNKQKRQVDVRMTIDFSDLRVRTQESVILTPAIVAKDGSRELELAPVVIDGRTRAKVHGRQETLTDIPFADDAYAVVRRRNGKSQQVDYAATVAYEPWMAKSRLTLREQATGCLECEEGSGETPIRNTFLKLFEPKYATPFVQPEREPVKVREEVRVARLQFRQNSHKIDPAFKGNQKELDEVIGSIELVKENTDLTIKGVYIKGYASPEGRMEYNRKLSQRRADALADYARKDTKVADGLWHVEGLGEDWDELRKQVEAHSGLLKQQEVLDIIDRRGSDLDAEERKLKALVPPEIYERLLNEMYGPVRRNEYRIEYEVRNFSIEEAKEQLQSRPDLLSVGEIYAVADSYGKGTPRYGEAMLTAAKTYPTNAAAVANAACWYLSQDDPAQAAELLENSQVKTDARVLNVLGVAYTRLARYDEARTVLTQAAQAGCADAKVNLEQLQGVVDDL